MSDMKEFSLWFIQNIPTFLTSEPINYIVSLFIAGLVIKVFFKMGGK